MDGASYAPYVGFEAGGQVELSWPCAPDVPTLARQVGADLAALRAGCLEAGIRLESSPVDVRPESEVPLQLDSPRYVAMERHFDTDRPGGSADDAAARRPHRSAWTGGPAEPGRSSGGCSTWPARSWRRPSRERGSDRLLTWLAVDPSRTAFDDGCCAATTRCAAYADFAAAAVFAPGTPSDRSARARVTRSATT